MLPGSLFYTYHHGEIVRCVIIGNDTNIIAVPIEQDVSFPHFETIPVNHTRVFEKTIPDLKIKLMEACDKHVK
jgi:hypothetical protein